MSLVRRPDVGALDRAEAMGTTDEVERFCAATWPRLVDAMTHYCGDVHLAEELVQEALLRACQRWSYVSQLHSPEGWTFRVAANLANSAWRRRRAEQRARQRHDARETVHRDPDSADRVALRRALDELSARQREVVVLRFFLDLPFERIAELTGLSSGGARASAHRAVARLRRSLDVTTDLDQEDARHAP